MPSPQPTKEPSLRDLVVRPPIPLQTAQLRHPTAQPRAGRPHLPGWVFGLMFLCLIATVDGMNFTACDCDSPEHISIVNLSAYSACNMPPTNVKYILVIYSIFELRNESQTFESYLCKVWKKGVKTDEFWDTSTDTVTYEAPTPISAADCTHLISSRDYYGNNMQQRGSVWIYTRDP